LIIGPILVLLRASDSERTHKPQEQFVRYLT